MVERDSCPAMPTFVSAWVTWETTPNVGKNARPRGHPGRPEARSTICGEAALCYKPSHFTGSVVSSGT